MCGKLELHRRSVEHSRKLQGGKILAKVLVELFAVLRVEQGVGLDRDAGVPEFRKNILLQVCNLPFEKRTELLHRAALNCGYNLVAYPDEDEVGNLLFGDLPGRHRLSIRVVPGRPGQAVLGVIVRG